MNMAGELRLIVSLMIYETALLSFHPCSIVLFHIDRNRLRRLSKLLFNLTEYGLGNKQICFVSKGVDEGEQVV